MIALITTVFVASLLGSLHCVGMCSAFLVIVTGDGPKLPSQIGYHAGRLLTYVTLGALAGALGHGLNVSSTMAGLGPVATALSATAIVGMGAMMWLRLKGIALPHFRGPKLIQTVASRGYRFAMQRPPVQRAMIVGLLTTLLPCGWLWTFLITAGGTARPLAAAGTMFVFWLGTLPAMVAVGATFRGLLGSLQTRLPTLTCLAMIAVGLVTVFHRGHLDPAAWAMPSSTVAATPPCCDIDAYHAN